MPTRYFAVIGQKARASEDFLLDDFPGTSGRLDVLVRCLRAALLSSHGVRRDVVVYLVLRGGPLAPRVVRVDGATITFLRPDERHLAVTMKKVLANRDDESSSDWVTVRPGFSLVRGDFERVLDDVGDATPYVLERDGEDVRNVEDLAHRSGLFVLGDHIGLPEDVRTRLLACKARPISLGPVNVHADDAVTLVTNELDRRVAREGGS